MADTAEPPENRRSRIVAELRLGEHDVLTTSEIADEFPGMKARTIRRNLHWMREQGLISGRRTAENGGGSTWLWWVAVDDRAAERLSAGEGVATASRISTLLRELYYGRREFQLIAAGVVTIPLLFGMGLWGVMLSELGIITLTLSEVFGLVGGGFLISFLLVIVGLFIFPIETMGNWPEAVDATHGDKRSE